MGELRCFSAEDGKLVWSRNLPKEFQTEPPVWGYWLFLFHVAVAMELVLLAPFIKFAHAIYRPLALFFMSFVAKEVVT